MEIIVWLVLLPLGAVTVAAWLYRMPDRGAVPQALRVARNRSWGEYHRFRRGKLWEPGEQELHRVSLLGVMAYSIDRHVQIQQRTTCIVTSRRVMVCDDRGSRVQILAGDIRTVRAHRVYDPTDGFSYSVVLERVGSTVHDPEGDLRLLCASQEQSRDLVSAIEDLRSAVPR
jgi:hypothetical protein